MTKIGSIGVLIGSLLASGPALAAFDPFLGETMIVAFDFCPKGWAATNGQLLPINQNQALFSLLGTNYGGNGQTTFALPNEPPPLTATGVALTRCIALQGIFPSQN
jgi:microcystin-dependent protein